MENIEDKLYEYRRRKTRRETFQRYKDKVRGFLMPKHKEEQVLVIDCPTPEEQSDDSEVVSSEDFDESTATSVEDASNDKFLKYTLRVVLLAFWITLYIIAIELQFGIVYLIISALVAIYLNTRTGPKKSNEVSAYSVFNKDFRSIDGTLKAEQFEREIGIR
ncbi:SAYSVFN motif domain containing 1 [Haematobia irritans]|uniref:SAYSVFN motif domain containing 1 n=1 Tax=Haematobia irritans TaxID=7368 RepID=UPI003F501630